jgi:hypothetical protein
VQELVLWRARLVEQYKTEGRGAGWVTPDGKLVKRTKGTTYSPNYPSNKSPTPAPTPFSPPPLPADLSLQACVGGGAPTTFTAPRQLWGLAGMKDNHTGAGVIELKASPGLCVEAGNGGTPNRTHLQVGECSKRIAMFAFNASAVSTSGWDDCNTGGRCGQLILGVSDMCVDIEGTSVVLTPCVAPSTLGPHGASTQMWVLGGSGRIFPGDKKSIRAHEWTDYVSAQMCLSV